MPHKKNESNQPEWSVYINVDDIGTSSKRISISPNQQESQNIAARVGVVEITKLNVVYKIKRQNKLTIYLDGRLDAEIIQECVKTLTPIKSKICETFEAWYAEKHKAVSFARAKAQKEAVSSGGEQPMLEEHEDPEPVIDGKIDLGEVAVQYLSLFIDPYPLVENEISTEEAAAGEDYQSIYKDEGANPFAALKQLRNTDENK